jgi:hypothetical protein
MSRSIAFQEGTLVLYDVDAHEPVPAPFRLIKGRWRCEGYHYGPLQPELHAQGLRDTVPRWQRLDLPLQETHEPHACQVEALAAWEQAGRRGSIVLPTGAGKTFVAIQPISRVNRSTLVVAPTIDLLHRWYARLVNAFGRDVGVYYGGEKQVLPLTVSTYHSAGDLVAAWGNAFKLVIFDEVHHLPAPTWGYDRALHAGRRPSRVPARRSPRPASYRARASAPPCQTAPPPPRRPLATARGRWRGRARRPR